jgi:3',5'-cyclic AMP phosphodiesterase CpdA
VFVVLLWAGQAFAWAFAVCGDSRDDKNGIFPQILSAVDASDMEFLLHTGDLVTNGTDVEWEAFGGVTAAFRKPLRVAVGNHDVRRGTRDGFAQRFGLPETNYSFRHKDAHFAIVDNAGGALSDNTLAWLDRDLAAHTVGTDCVSVIVVAMHVPPRTAGITPHGVKRDYEEQSAKLLGILKRHRVELVLSSHEHMHHDEDWEGVRVIVSGGAGAPLVPFQRYGYYRIDVDGGRIRGTFLPVRGGGHSSPTLTDQECPPER